MVPNGNPLWRRDNVLDILIFVTLENPVENPHFIFGFWSLFLDYIFMVIALIITQLVFESI